MSPGPIQLDQATALTLMLGPNGSVGIQASRETELIYDWNRASEVAHGAQRKPIELDDETLRDGLQSPSVISPPIEKKIEILHLMEAVGIHAANIGLPGAGPHVQKQVLRLARAIVDQRMKIQPNCAARTLKTDIEPIVEISQKAGIAIEAATFIGSSPIRQYVESWEFDRLVKHTEEAVRFTVANGLPNMYVTEDTTRARPETIRIALYDGHRVRCAESGRDGYGGARDSRWRQGSDRLHEGSGGRYG